MNKPKIEHILIACCTCLRPKTLRLALQSIKDLNYPKDVKVELLVIDNDKNMSGKEAAEEYGCHYVVEENRGIANARNRLLKEAINLNATHIAMFDDDEVVDKNWLVNHVNFYNENENVLISSGPTYNKFSEKYPAYITKNKIFKSSTTKKTGLVREICASGNVFFPVAIAKESNIYFDSTYIFMGGEDGDFFSRASKAGYTIVWNNEAVNYEVVGKDRANIKWILNRQYYNGYSGVLLGFKGKKKKISYLIKTIITVILDALLIPLSILLGFTTCLNVIGITYKNFGKIVAFVKGKEMNYYENICGE